MSTKTWERNTSVMVAHARQRREDTRTRVDATIAAMARGGQTINFNTVAREAGVTKAYLYTHAPIRERIEALREQDPERHVRDRAAHQRGKTDASKDLVIMAKERRISALEDEVRRLKHELHAGLGQLYDRI